MLQDNFYLFIHVSITADIKDIFGIFVLKSRLFFKVLYLQKSKKLIIIIQ